MVQTDSQHILKNWTNMSTQQDISSQMRLFQVSVSASELPNLAQSQSWGSDQAIVLPHNFFRTEIVPVRLAVQILVLFVVIARKRGVGDSYFVPQDPPQIHRTLFHWCMFFCKVIVGLVNFLTLSMTWTYSFRKPYVPTRQKKISQAVASRRRTRRLRWNPGNRNDSPQKYRFEGGPEPRKKK